MSDNALTKDSVTNNAHSISSQEFVRQEFPVAKANAPLWIVIVVLIFVALSDALMRMNDGSYITLLPYISIYFNFTYSRLGIFPMSGRLAAVISGFLSALFSRCIHPYRMLLLGLFIWSVTELIRGFSVNSTMYLITEIFLGLSQGPIMVFAAPLMMLFVPDSLVTMAFFAIFGIGSYLGLGIGVVVSNAFADRTDNTLFTPYRIFGGAGLVMLLIFVFPPLIKRVERVRILDSRENIWSDTQTSEQMTSEQILTKGSEEEKEIDAKPRSRYSMRTTLSQVLRGSANHRFEMWASILKLLQNFVYLPVLIASMAISISDKGLSTWLNVLFKTKYEEGAFLGPLLEGDVLAPCLGLLIGAVVYGCLLKRIANRNRHRAVRVGLIYTITCLMLSTGVGTALVWFPDSLWLFATGYAISQLLSLMCSQALTLVLLHSVRPEQRIDASMLVNLVSTTASAISSLVAGYVQEDLGTDVQILVFFGIAWFASFMLIVALIVHCFTRPFIMDIRNSHDLLFPPQEINNEECEVNLSNIEGFHFFGISNMERT